MSLPSRQSLRAWRLHARAAVGPIAIAAAVAGIFIDAHAWLATYLAVAFTYIAISVGALAVLMTTYLVRGKWTEHLHGPLLAAALALPVAGLVFIPLLIGLPALYPWVAESERHGALQAVYLTPLFFVVRSALYFLIWTALGLWIKSAWGDLARMTRTASVGLIIYALTASFAAIDWIESLTPDLHSSMFGLLLIGFQLLAGLAFGVALALRGGGEPYRYGETLLSVLLLWAYLHAMQYIVVWAADIPEEARWYLDREEGAWGVVLWGLLLLQFIVPFFALLSERVRYGRGPLMMVALLTLVLRLVEALWLVLPGTRASGPVLALDIPALTLGIGWIWWMSVAFNLRRLRGDSIPPRLAAMST